ncbi:GNAT family N-acetyltransferase [Aeromonas caviae]|uniref:GNAT family N-acetyltransferase n=1 Tax=Aeromonas caviae TaxID=648 RepID=UPI0038D244C3
MLFIAPEARGGGVGRQLVDHAIRCLGATRVVSIHRNSIDTGKMRRSSLDPTFLLA